MLDRPYFARWIRSLADLGHEVCLHGTTHLGGDGELATRCPAEAAAQLAEGADLCAQLGLNVSGFVPPCGRLSGAGRLALAARGFTYAVLGAEIDLLGCGRRLPAPVVALDAGSVPTRLWARARYFIRRRSPHLRLTVQPAALYHPAQRDTLLALVRAALASRTALTCGELAARG